jgi:hypothetical protein
MGSASGAHHWYISLHLKVAAGCTTGFTPSVDIHLATILAVDPTVQTDLFDTQGFKYFANVLVPLTDSPCEGEGYLSFGGGRDEGPRLVRAEPPLEIQTSDAVSGLGKNSLGT